MKTPIIDFIKKYKAKKPIRLHMPGHKGKGFLGKFDITEINGADVLYSPSGIILQSENNATSLFNTAHTFYSCEGSTLCIKAMLHLVTKGVKDPVIIATRNSHIAFLNACVLLGIKVVWLYGQRDTLCSIKFDLQELETALLTNPNACGVYLTSPDYLGYISPIKEISKICKNKHISLLVDNAHASYSAFLKDNFHPISLGADLVCDSAHKTLPTLTGGAYLHVSKSCPTNLLDNARNALKLFASTSPSYLILQSLDYTNLYLKNNLNKFDILADKITKLKLELFNNGYNIISGEPFKIVINISDYGYTKTEFYTHLQKFKIEPEMIENDYSVFMFSTNNTNKDLKTLKKALLTLPKKTKIEKQRLNFVKTKQVLSIRTACLKDSREILVDNAEGSICSQSIVTCPPAIPIIISGELVTKEIIELLKYYEVKTIQVIKN